MAPENRETTGCRARLVALAALLSAVAAGLLGAAAPALAGDGAKGKATFEQSCSGCHTVGGGDSVGPDLQGVGDRQDPAWIRAFILAPDEVIASGDPIAKDLVAKYKGVQMPNLGLTATQVDDLLAFLGVAATAPTETTTTTPAPTTPAPTKPASGADATRGQHLFTGAASLRNGGPSCLSCHSVAGVGALGGGRLGPDLTNVAGRLNGAQGLDGWLKAVASPTMQPIFSANPLTDAERADLVAFLVGAADQKRAGGDAWGLFLLSVGVLALLGLAGFLIWRGRLTGVRRPLVDNSRGK